ncbi:hypothetical protein G5714_002522 [Onychostoma macrolepis]|uniref:Uncharacterized protein n=1 Tax=Onychostoma macrolepis TaxID=369639 RepID=A0A7J6D6Y8_9TELE|nr:hypothetical protein G5714_002522 [Onychostoma macrolepis]
MEPVATPGMVTVLKAMKSPVKPAILPVDLLQLATAQNADPEVQELSKKADVQEKRPSSRKEKFVQLTVSLANDLDKHKVLCPEDGTYVTGIPYNNEQITEEPSEMFTVVMHFKLNILACSHPDYDWIGGIETVLHGKTTESESGAHGSVAKSKTAHGRASELTCVTGQNAEVGVDGQSDGGADGGERHHSEAEDSATTLQMDEYHTLDNFNIGNIVVDIN